MEIKFTQTPNYAKGTGIKKIGFVLHGTLGAYKGAVEWLMTPKEKRKDKSQSSAHYVIGRNEGEVTQLVKESDIAWHAGNISNPTARAQKVLPKKNGKYLNPNDYFIGIEFAWGYDTDKDGDIDTADKTLTEWQYKCAMEIMRASGVYSADTTLSHKEITDYKGDDMLPNVLEINKRFSTPPEPTNREIVEQIETKLAEVHVLLAKIVI